MSFVCEYCNKEFKTKGTLKTHQEHTKYCLDLQGKISNIYKCQHCSKNLTSEKNFREHLNICKEKYKEKVEELEKIIEKIKKEYEDKYEKKLEKQKQEYEEKLEKHQEFIKTMAMKPTTNHKTMNVINNHNNILNFNDKEKLNNVIRNNIDQEIVKKGQIGFAGVLYQNYLKNEEGNLLYHIVDTSRQHFGYIDENGEKKTDIGARALTEAVVKSDLSKHVSNIAKDMPDLYEKNGNLESVLQLTEFEKDNSKFRKEIVRLTNSNK